jgi:hypothetical protein
MGVPHMHRWILATTAALTILGGAGAMAFAAGGPTTAPSVGHPGCFGNWRAGSVQMIDQNGGNAGLIFAERASSNATINMQNRQTCETPGS